MEITMPVINKTPDDIKQGQLCYVEKKQLHIFLFGKFRRYRWYYRLFFKHPVEVGIISNIDTSQFKEGENLYLDPNNAGSLINKN